MMVKNAKFEITAVRPEQYPVGGMPEIAFVGRSNAGKSSALNALINRKSLARVGGEPGKTREINFYNIDGVLYFVDLPGYGYAGVSKEKKSTWSTVVETYLNSRQQLKLIIMMVDIRHLPSKDDIIMYKWLFENKMPHIVIASKSDKISKAQIKPRLQEIRTALGMGNNITLLPLSSESKQGIPEVWSKIEEMIR